MTSANQPAPQPTGQLSRRWIALILAVVFGSLTLWSLCAGFAYFSLNGVPASLVPSALAPATAPLGNPRAQTDPNYWWTARVLSQVYTAAVDHVASDPAVIDLLGEPIEVDYQSDELYRREGTGELNPLRETITFDVSGPKGSASVTVVAATSAQSYQIREITMVSPDGASIRVPPPEAGQFSIR
jgi:hypothetical protein